jgi:hypothetical protein
LYNSLRYPMSNAYVQGDTTVIHAINRGEFFNENNRMPGGIDQFNLFADVGIHTIGHESGHMVQRRLHDSVTVKGFDYDPNAVMDRRHTSESALGLLAYIKTRGGQEIFSEPDRRHLTNVESKVNIRNTMSMLTNIFYDVQIGAVAGIPKKGATVYPTLEHWSDISGYIATNLIVARLKCKRQDKI